MDKIDEDKRLLGLLKNWIDESAWPPKISREQEEILRKSRLSSLPSPVEHLTSEQAKCCKTCRFWTLHNYSHPYCTERREIIKGFLEKTVCDKWQQDLIDSDSVEFYEKFKENDK